MGYLFNDAISSTDYITSNVRMTGEQRIGEDEVVA